MIREVFVDGPLAGQASIMGKGFGTMPRVEFGEFGDIGFVSATDMEIVIELPTTDPGEYLIIVTASAEDGGGDDCKDDNDDSSSPGCAVRFRCDDCNDDDDKEGW